MVKDLRTRVEVKEEVMEEEHNEHAQSCTAPFGGGSENEGGFRNARVPECQRPFSLSLSGSLSLSVCVKVCESESVCMCMRVHVPVCVCLSVVLAWLENKSRVKRMANAPLKVCLYRLTWQ
jgi:hypothetical protein